MDEPRRNDVFDRELRRALAAEGGAASGPHVDAELAAAWMDRRLDTVAARSIEAHLAGCQECQILMATLARIAPDVAAAREGIVWWRRFRAGWVVPATVAAAAGLVIWVAVPQQRAASTPAEPLQARVDRGQAIPPPATPPPANEFAPSLEKQTAPLAAAETEAKADRRAAPEAPMLQKKEADAPPAPALERRERFADAAVPAAPAPAPATPPPPVAAPRQPESLQETVTVQGQTPIVDANRVTVAGESAARANERQDASAPQRSLRGAVGGTADLRASSALVVAAPSGARWRRTGTLFEFAPRADAPFSAVPLPVAADAINAGASPGGTVCWLAGIGGLVLVSLDGSRFARVTAPASVNLVAVVAADARTATVTASDGRRFRTADQGATWTTVP